MSKERLSRIDYLRDKLSQMGHPPANRIVWENELEKLLKQSKPIKQSKPTKIRGSIKPRKCKHVAWNRKLLQGYKSDESGWLPTGYFRSHADYVIPPYLEAAWKSFLAGRPVYGKYWFNSLAAMAQKGQQASGKHWGSKKSKKQVHSNPEVRAEFRQDVDEFFRLMPCVPFTECRDRFPEDMFGLGINNKEAQKKIAGYKELQDQKKIARNKELQEAVEASRAALKAAIKAKEGQWERVEAGRQAFIAKFGHDFGL